MMLLVYCQGVGDRDRDQGGLISFTGRLRPRRLRMVTNQKLLLLTNEQTNYPQFIHPLI